MSAGSAAASCQRCASRWRCASRSQPRRPVRPIRSGSNSPSGSRAPALRRIVLTVCLLAGELALKPRAPTRRGLKLRRELVTARVTVLLVLGLVGRDRLLDDLPRDPVIVNVRVTARVRGQLRAIDRDDPEVTRPGPGAEPQHRTEQLIQRLLMTTDEPRDRRVIRRLVTGDHPVGDVLTTTPLDPTRGPLIRRIRVQNEATIIDGSYAARPCPSAR